MITHTISSLELIWSLITCAGLFFSAISFAAAIVDFHYLQHVEDYIPGGPRAVIALNHLATEFLRGLTQALLFTAGIIAMIAPNPHQHLTAMAIATISLFIAAGSLLAFSSVLSFFARRKVIVTLRERLPEEIPEN